jgi:hypothetical protein
LPQLFRVVHKQSSFESPTKFDRRDTGIAGACNFDYSAFCCAIS